MAKKKTEAAAEPAEYTNEDIINQICAAIPGAEILTQDQIAAVGFISTGNFALDYAISGRLWDGGAPLGRISEFYGPSSTGKTVIGTHLLQGCQKKGGISVLIDSESAYSEAFGRALGLDTRFLIYDSPECLEECYEKMYKFVEVIRGMSTNDKPLAIVYDSIAASPSRREVETIKKGEEFKAEMGERARISSQYLRTINSFMARQKVAIIIINQIRQKVGVVFGNPETTAGGGNSLEYYCSVRGDCRKTGVLKDASGAAIGIKMRVTITKNKIAKPFRKVEDLELFFDYGISPTSGLVDVLVGLGRLEKNGSWWRVPGCDAKFQGDENIPRIIVEHPEMVDAPSSEAVMAFLQRNQASLTASRDLVAEAVQEESE